METKTHLREQDPSRRDGGGPEAVAHAPGYCGFCGADLDGAGVAWRFREPFCGEAHAEAFAAEVRAGRIGAAATARTMEESATAPEVDGGGERSAARGWDLKRTLKMAVCCGAPLLAVVLLAGGGVAFLGAGAAVLPYLALLACPLAMFFMMRAMHHDEKHQSQAGQSATRRSEGQGKP